MKNLHPKELSLLALMSMIQPMIKLKLEQEEKNNLRRVIVFIGMRLEEVIALPILHQPITAIA
jgi:hypothetical protein